MKNLLTALLSIIAIAAPIGIETRAAVTPAPAFCDHAVLQRDKPVPVWGKAAPGEAVTVTFKDQTRKTAAGADGKWRVMLAAMPASKTPATLTIAGENTIAVNDVLVGDVWFCSGQSNMAFMVQRGKDAEKEIAAANYPLIRHIKAKVNPTGELIDTIDGVWTVCSPATAGEFTAVGYFFARDLHKELDVPIGLINSSRGGSPIESWLAPRSLSEDAIGKTVIERWQRSMDDYPKAKKKYDNDLATWKKSQTDGKKSAKGKPRAPIDPSLRNGCGGLYNGMVNPFVPYAIRGFLWYQGEANARRNSTYAALMETLITRWRESFGQGALPFYWVQLPNFNYNTGGDTTDRAKLREAQDKTLALPATGQAVTIDIGEPRDNHPKNKQEVGRRLALIAKANVYGIKCEYSGPRLDTVQPEGSALRVRFTHTTGGLVAKAQPIAGFEIAGADGKYHPATATIKGDTVLLKSDAVAKPVYARYAWDDCPTATLFNGEGLPAAPFRTDK